MDINGIVKYTLFCYIATLIRLICVNIISSTEIYVQYVNNRL